MQYNVATLLREPVGSTRNYAIEAEAPIHGGTVEFVRTPGAVLVRAQADAIIDSTCSRCLAPIGYRVHLAFEEEFFQQTDVISGARLSPDRADEGSFWIGADHVIDIREALRQYAEVAADMQPLCRPDCPGLCPGCGRDLAIDACTCESGPVDRRWLALAALKQPRDGE